MLGLLESRLLNQSQRRSQAPSVEAIFVSLNRRVTQRDAQFDVRVDLQGLPLPGER